METEHKLEAKDGVQICIECGAALHKDGYWWLGGRKSKVEPKCGEIDSVWFVNSIDGIQELSPW